MYCSYLNGQTLIFHPHIQKCMLCVWYVKKHFQLLRADATGFGNMTRTQIPGTNKGHAIK